MTTRKCFVREASGATVISYGLSAGRISVVIITAVSTVGTNLNSKFQTSASVLK